MMQTPVRNSKFTPPRRARRDFTLSRGADFSPPGSWLSEQPQQNLNTDFCLVQQWIHLLSVTERAVYGASMSAVPQLSLKSKIVGLLTLKRPDRRRAKAALWRAAKAEGRAPTADNSWVYRSCSPPPGGVDTLAPAQYCERS